MILQPISYGVVVLLVLEIMSLCPGTQSLLVFVLNI